MASIKIPSFSSVRAFLQNPPLGDASVPSGPVALQLSEEICEDIPAGGGPNIGSVRIGVGLAASVSIVNDRNDANAENCFDFGNTTAVDPGTSPDALEISAPIVFDERRAYVVLGGVSATGRLTADAAGRGLGGGLDGSAQLSLATCTAFDRATPLRDAVAKTCQDFKTIFSVADIAALRSDEMLIFGVRGGLKLSAQISANSLADALGSGLSRVFTASYPVRLSATPTASLQIDFEIDDGYRIYVQCGEKPGERIFSVRKAANRVLAADASVGIDVALPQSQMLVAEMKAAFCAITDLPGTLVDRALASAPVESLSPSETSLVEKAVSLLKLRDPAIPAWQRLKTALQEIQAQTEAIIPQQVSARLGYTWRRLTSDSHVARFRIQADALARNHANILRLNLAALMEEAKSASGGVVFEQFLGKRVRTLELGWGFSFGLNDFTFLQSLDRSSATYIFLRDLDDRVQASFLGKRGYTRTWLDRSVSHQVELNASMPHFAPAPLPADFQLGFSASFTWDGQLLSDIFDDLIDHAVVLGALQMRDLAQPNGFVAQARLLAERTVSACASIMVPPAIMPALLSRLSGDDESLIAANAMARALPPGTKWGHVFKERGEVDARMKAYAAIWGNFLAHSEMDEDQLGRFAGKIFSASQPELSRLEADSRTGGAWSVQGIARTFGGAEELHRACDALRRCLQQLAQRGAPGVTYQVFQYAARDLAPLWADHYGARVFAALLFLTAAQAPGALARVVRKVSLTWQEEDRTSLLGFASGEEFSG
ncbi:MAG TPA: hypothetical protein VFT72_17995 [Opitutaceae bacterium]|nr:hypothetical protein [Opitutaceae bacterium]